MQRASFDTVLTTLTQDQTPRVWSFLVSVFGELAQNEGAQISGTLLRRLTEVIGIKPEAVRVAIHRLRKEGWIDSRRNGRTSAYSLTPWGRAQSAEASPRIYAPDQAADRAWLVIFNPAQPAPVQVNSGAWISSNVLVTSEIPSASQGFVSALDDQTALPDWMTDKICTAQAVRMSQELAQALDTGMSHLETLPDLNQIQIATLRIILVHSWRRIVLKTPVLPDHVFPREWRGPHCRAVVAKLLSRYPNPGQEVLEKSVNAFARAN